MTRADALELGRIVFEAICFGAIIGVLVML